MRLPSLLKQTNNDNVNLFVGISLILAFLIKFYNTVIFYTTSPNPLRTFYYSEFLINFQGGFVRRGLLGELLYQLYTYTHYPLVPFITVISYVAFFTVFVFFFYKFYKQKYCWWILLSPLFLGYTMDIVRKDFILYCLLIGVLYESYDSSRIKVLFASFLVCLGLFLHEAFIFWGYPIYVLILLSRPCNKLLKWILIIIPIAIFALLSIFKGNAEVAHQIVDSWNSIIPGQPLTYSSSSSIGSIGWETLNTFKMHLNWNASKWGSGIVLIPLYLCAGYYMFTNFLFVFSKQSIEKKDSNKLVLSLVYSLTALCMIPMFTVLSCDTGRNFQYISVVTFATFLIIPSNAIISSFPKWYKRLVIRFNNYITKVIPPSQKLIIIMLLFVGMCPYIFSLQSCLCNSVIGTFYITIKKLII